MEIPFLVAADSLHRSGAAESLMFSRPSLIRQVEEAWASSSTRCSVAYHGERPLVIVYSAGAVTHFVAGASFDICLFQPEPYPELRSVVSDLRKLFLPKRSPGLYALADKVAQLQIAGGHKDEDLEVWAERLAKDVGGADD